jgi:shikimate dehydrogenase
MPFLDEIDQEAQQIGAVNTIKIEGLKTIGFNTDAYGFHQSIKPFLTNKHERALVIGTGGASKAVEHILKKIGLDVFFISRTKCDRQTVFRYEEMNNHMINACKLIVNCTPIGMVPNVNERIPFPYPDLTTEHLVIDLIYNPQKTKFLEQAELNGAMILNGSSMLREQAMQSWKIWTKGI